MFSNPEGDNPIAALLGVMLVSFVAFCFLARRDSNQPYEAIFKTGQCVIDNRLEEWEQVTYQILQVGKSKYLLHYYFDYYLGKIFFREIDKLFLEVDQHYTAVTCPMYFTAQTE